MKIIGFILFYLSIILKYSSYMSFWKFIFSKKLHLLNQQDVGMYALIRMNYTLFSRFAALILPLLAASLRSLAYPFLPAFCLAMPLSVRISDSNT